MKKIKLIQYIKSTIIIKTICYCSCMFVLNFNVYQYTYSFYIYKLSIEILQFNKINHHSITRDSYLIFNYSTFAFFISIYYTPEPEKRPKCNLIIYSDSSEDSIIKLIINIIYTNEWSNEIHKRWLNILRSNEKDYFIIFFSILYWYIFQL